MTPATYNDDVKHFSGSVIQIGEARRGEFTAGGFTFYSQCPADARACEQINEVMRNMEGLWSAWEQEKAAHPQT